MIRNEIYDSYADYAKLIKKMWSSWDISERDISAVLEELRRDGHHIKGIPAYEEDYVEEED